MSNEAISWAFAQTMSPTCKLVLVALANRANDAGECWPSVGTIMGETGLSDRAVQRSISELQERGAIERRERRGTSTVFRCTMKAIEPPTQCHPRQAVTPDAVSPPPDTQSPPPPTHSHPPPDTVSPKPSMNPQREPSLNHQSARATAGGGFDAFWAAYPRKVSKGAAERAWAAAVKQTDAATILAGLSRWKPPNDPQFTPHPATWLNGKRWADEEPDNSLDARLARASGRAALGAPEFIDAAPCNIIPLRLA